MTKLSYAELPQQYIRAFPKLRGYTIAVYQRDNKHAPYIVCAVDPDDKPLLEAGFSAFSEMTNPQQILMMSLQNLGQVLTF